jgi:N-methylhydantoinase B/oxoprolinase/acetone carboxylase alpha subunit
MTVTPERVMDDQDFQQTVLDFFEIATQRHRDIMTQGSDILAKIAALSSAFDAVKAVIDKELAAISETVPAGHSAVLDTLVSPLDELQTKVGALGDEVGAKIKAMPVPGAAVPPAS